MPGKRAEIAECASGDHPLLPRQLYFGYAGFHAGRGPLLVGSSLWGANLLNLKPCIEVDNSDGSMHVGKKATGEAWKRCSPPLCEG